MRLSWSLWVALAACRADAPPPLDVSTADDVVVAEERAAQVVVEGRLGMHEPLADVHPVPALALRDGSLLALSLDALPNPPGLLDALEGQRVWVEGSVVTARPPLAVHRLPRPAPVSGEVVQVDYAVEAASLSVRSPR